MRFQLVMASVLASAAAFGLPPASAGTFSITPLRLDLAAQSTTASLTVRNEQDTPALVQAEALAWAQAEGEERLSGTSDVLVSPIVFTLPPKGSQLVRVALRREPDPARELSYRLILQEVPPEASPDFTGLKVALKLSMPIFVAPTVAATPELTFSATRGPKGALVLRADNGGGAHARVLGFTLSPATGDGPVLQDSVAAYILPGQHREWTLQNDNKTRDGASNVADRYRLKASTERGEVVAELTVAR